jgi:hypothetical protein
MKLPNLTLACCTGLLLIGGMQFAAPAEQAAKAATTSKNPDVDSDALAALDRMTAALRSHKTFTLTADITDEDVLDGGEKLQFAGKVQAAVRTPDRFRLSSIADGRDREFYYNGKTVTVFSPKLGLYAAFAAPPTIGETLDKASEKYDIEFPLADLFVWDKEMAADLTSGFMVRPENIGGQTCDHYAFRQKDVDWQIWIAESSSLPCKLVITTRDDPSMPQYTALLHWNFPSTIADSDFTFTPPADAHKIVIATLADADTGKGNK